MKAWIQETKKIVVCLSDNAKVERESEIDGTGRRMTKAENSLVRNTDGCELVRNMLRLEFTALEQSLISSEGEVIEQVLLNSKHFIFIREMCIPQSFEVLSDLSVSLQHYLILRYLWLESPALKVLIIIWNFSDDHSYF